MADILFVLGCVAGIAVWVWLDWDAFKASIVEDYEGEDI